MHFRLQKEFVGKKKRPWNQSEGV